MLRFKLLAASLALLLNGCAFHPYVSTPGLKTSLPPASTSTTPQFAGDLEQAIKDVDAQRLAYLDKLESRTIQRNVLSSALIGLTAGALYKGVNSAAGASSRAVANLGAAAGGAYALGTYSNSPPTEQAYIIAMNDLSCLVLRTRPWLVKSEDFGTFTTTVASLLTATNALDAEYQRQAALSGDSKKFVKDNPFERAMLYKARVTLRKASNFKGFVETAGFQLRQEAMLASNAANFEIHRNQPDLVNPSAVLASLRSTAQAFRDIKPLEVTPDEMPKDETDDDGKNKTGSPGAPGTPPTTAIPAKTKPDASPTASTDLGKQADKLAEQVTALDKQLAAQEKTNDKRAAATTKQLKALTAELKTLTLVVTALNSTQTASLTVVVSQLNTTSSVALAGTLSAVLAAMRPVNAVLTRAYSLKPYVKAIPECQPLNAQAFEFNYEPGEVTLNPGQTFEVAVKGGVGVPRIWLSGAIGGDKTSTPELTTSIDGGLPRAKLTLPANTPAGEMHIMAVDGSGRYSDDIKVMVVVPAKK